MEITNSLNPVVLPDLELGFHMVLDIALDICKLEDIVIDIAHDIVIDIACDVAYDNTMRYLL